MVIHVLGFRGVILNHHFLGIPEQVFNEAHFVPSGSLISLPSMRVDRYVLPSDFIAAVRRDDVQERLSHSDCESPEVISFPRRPHGSLRSPELLKMRPIAFHACRPFSSERADMVEQFNGKGLESLSQNAFNASHDF